MTGNLPKPEDLRTLLDYDFEAFDDAVAARKQAEKQYGFSARHGEARQ